MTPIQATFLISLIGAAIEKAFAAYTNQINQGITEEELKTLISKEQERHELLMDEYEKGGV